MTPDAPPCRSHSTPFPLYPGETASAIYQLTVVPAMSALRLKVLTDFVDQDGVARIAGDEFLFEGPGTFMPRKEVGILAPFEDDNLSH